MYIEMESIMKSMAVLIPAYNAEASLKELVERLHNSVGDVTVVVVDDGSTDRTRVIAGLTGAIVLQHEHNRGKGAALQTGFDFIKNLKDIKFILTMDADLQHQPEDCLKLLSAQKKTNADMVIGWRGRIGTNMPVHRRVSNTITSAMVGIKTGMKIKDSQCGFRLIRKNVAERIRIEANGYEAETEFLIKAARLGCTIEFIPVHTVYGNEKSYMTHWTTTVNFLKVLLRDYA